MSDLDGKCFVRRKDHLVPADVNAEEWLTEIKDGGEIIVTARRARSPEHHRWFFAMLRAIVENSDRWQTESELLDAIKLATGHYERRQKLNGEVYQAPKSINFAALDQLAFKRFVDRAVFVLAQIGIDAESFMVPDMKRATKKPKPPARLGRATGWVR